MQHLYLGMVVVAFAAFMITLFAAAAWSQTKK